MRPFVPFLIVATTLIAACAGNPKPGEQGYPYNLTGRYSAEFLVEGTAYRGTMDLSTAPGGTVSGSFAVTDPVQVVGSVEGTILGDSLDFLMPYEVIVEGCAGTLHGRAGIHEGGAGFVAPVSSEGPCGAGNGTVTVSR